MSQDTIEGYVDHIIFRNEDNGYTVLNLIVKGSEVTWSLMKRNFRKIPSLWNDISAPALSKAWEPL